MSLPVTFSILAISFQGLVRTDEIWLRDYMQVSAPITVNAADVRRLRDRLLTTDIFSKVDVRVSAIPDSNPPADELIVEVKEKWTTIPVIRGAYGGGTPLLVLGIYDTNVGGRLLTVGAEMRRYGNNPPGGVAYFKAPRAFRGSASLGLELWKDRRRRTFYDSQSGDEMGAIDSDANMVRAQALLPVAPNLQAGLFLEGRQELATVFEHHDETPATPPKVNLEDTSSTLTTVWPTVVYDALTVRGIDMDGLRVLNRYGPMWDQGKPAPRYEGEFFYFRVLPPRFNIAVHGLAGASASSKLNHLYFLGGFDSVRGLPDGILYGNHVGYTNLEMRTLLGGSPVMEYQSAVFVDHGGAGFSWQEISKKRRTSSGVGMRINFPRIYRLMLRLDYAWAIDGQGGRGFSIGLNQFFQPYRPL